MDVIFVESQSCYASYANVSTSSARTAITPDLTALYYQENNNLNPAHNVIKFMDRMTIHIKIEYVWLICKWSSGIYKVSKPRHVTKFTSFALNNHRRLENHVTTSVLKISA